MIYYALILTFANVFYNYVWSMVSYVGSSEAPCFETEKSLLGRKHLQQLLSSLSHTVIPASAFMSQRKRRMISGSFGLTPGDFTD